MKKTLKEIIEKNEEKELKKYLQEGNSIDYSFYIRHGNGEYNLNTLVFCLLSKQNLGKIILNELDDLSLKDFLCSIHKSLNMASIFINNENIFSKKELDLIYRYIPDESKKEVSNRINRFSIKDLKEKNILNYLDEKILLRKILEEDDHIELIEFINKNKDFNYSIKSSITENYLMLCLQNNSVLCFDILKDHMKALKVKSSNKIKP